MTGSVPPDDELLGYLKAAYDHAVPASPTDADFARASHTLLRLDEELVEATLTADSWDEPALIRRAHLPGARFLVFGVDNGSIEIEIEVAPGLLLGRLDPAESAQVTLSTMTGPARHATATPTGQFEFEEPPSGMARLTCESSAVHLQTTWMRI